MFDDPCSAFYIRQEEKDSQVLLVFPLLRLEAYWLFTQGEGLAHCFVLEQKFICVHLTSTRVSVWLYELGLVAKSNPCGTVSDTLRLSSFCV